MTDPRPAHRVHDARMDEAQIHALASGEVALFSVRSPDREGPNEDSAAIFPFGDEAFVLVVADGVGGGGVPTKRSSWSCTRTRAGRGRTTPPASRARTAALSRSVRSTTSNGSMSRESSGRKH